mmetsp:Transcript_12810/g.25333  ORF Transcript_12810/g.25333 Transcript_12810/m.25333 type:complete len:469 (+) Transcript_12810:157-1563(+)
MAPHLSTTSPLTSVETVAEHAIKMGWAEKEAEESYFGAGWNKKFLVLTGWDDGEAHLFYYDKETDTEAAGVLFVNDVSTDPVDKVDRVLTLQGTQRRFRFRCATEEEAKTWRVALTEAKTNGGHKCLTGVASTAWMAEKHAKTCDKCRQLFTASNRKHHCRCCGRIFCDGCSNSPKIALQPYPAPVRCCNHCHETQGKQAKEEAERAERAKVFVAKHLGLLEEGGDFECLQRSDLIRTIGLDTNTSMSLQYRKLVITESIHPDAAARMAGALKGDASNSLSRIKAGTMRVGAAVASLRPNHIVEAFKPAQAAENIKTIRARTLEAAHTTVDSVHHLGQHAAGTITDLVEGPRQHEIEVRHIKGVIDYAENPTIMSKNPLVAPRTFAIFIQSATVPLELVAPTPDVKKQWLAALQELTVLAEDAGTAILLVQQARAQTSVAVQQKIERRRQDRQSAVMDSERVKSSTLR